MNRYTYIYIYTYISTYIYIYIRASCIRSLDFALYSWFFILPWYECQVRSKAMNPACRPHSKRRSAADSFAWPSNPSLGSSGRRNSGCPPGRTWDAHQQPATGRGSQGMIMDTRPGLKSNKWQMSSCVCKIVDGFTTENRSSTADLAWGHADKNVEKHIQNICHDPSVNGSAWKVTPC